MARNPASAEAIPASLMRGGTSRGIVFPLEVVPPEGPERDRFLIALMGSFDPGQVDGFGGNTSVTSKIMMVSHREDVEEIDYLFAQVDPRNPTVDYGGNCGNMTAAVALYAAMERLAEPTSPMTEIMLRNLNTATRIRALLPTGPDGPATAGDYRIAGISRPGAEIVTQYLDPAGPRGPFPTGKASEILDVPGVGDVHVSIVDIASPLVFVAAGDVGLVGTELPAAIDSDEALLSRLEAIRGSAAQRLGLVDRAQDAARRTPGIPKLTMVSAPTDYVADGGEQVRRDQVEVVVRMMSVQRAHHAIAITGTVCTAGAAALPGTVPHRIAGPARSGRVRLGHPKGTVEATLDVEADEGGVRVRSIGVSRTARCLMRGQMARPT